MDGSSSTQLIVAAAAGAAAATFSVYLLYRRRLSPAVRQLSEGFCVPCDEELEPVKRQRSHQLERQRSLKNAGPPKLSRYNSSNDIDDGLLAWSKYIEAPTQLYDSTGFIEGVGVQKITLPFKAHEIDKVAEWLEDEDRSGMGALRPLHRLSTRLGEFKAQFDSLDLGSYDDLTSAAVSEDGEPGSDEFDKLMWSLLIVEPNRFFPLHAHPQGEVIYVVRGALYENRVLTSALVNAPTTALADSGYPKLYRVEKKSGGEAFANPRFSVHQSYTLDEGAVLLVLWCGKHANLTDPGNAMWDVTRCSNPWCAMACPGGTFEALARRGAGGAGAELH